MICKYCGKELHGQQQAEDHFCKEQDQSYDSQYESESPAVDHRDDFPDYTCDCALCRTDDLNP